MFLAAQTLERDAPPSVGDTATITGADTVAAGEFQMTKSPLGAVLRSALIPGLGQLYNESYWKIPIVLGVSGFLIYGYIAENNDYAYYRDLYEANKDLEFPEVNLVRTKLYREFYRDRRDTYAWWFGVFYLVQIADAFVDAHLYDFDVSGVDVAFHVSPTGQAGVSVSW